MYICIYTSKRDQENTPIYVMCKRDALYMHCVTCKIYRRVFLISCRCVHCICIVYALYMHCVTCLNLRHPAHTCLNLRHPAHILDMTEMCALYYMHCICIIHALCYLFEPQTSSTHLFEPMHCICIIQCIYNALCYNALCYSFEPQTELQHNSCISLMHIQCTHLYNALYMHCDTCLDLRHPFSHIPYRPVCVCVCVCVCFLDLFCTYNVCAFSHCLL